MNDNQLEEMLKRYVPSADRKELHSYPSDEEIDHTFSEEFENKMRKLIEDTWPEQKER